MVDGQGLMALGTLQRVAGRQMTAASQLLRGIVTVINQPISNVTAQHSAVPPDIGHPGHFMVHVMGPEVSCTSKRLWEHVTKVHPKILLPAEAIVWALQHVIDDIEQRQGLADGLVTQGAFERVLPGANAAWTVV